MSDVDCREPREEIGTNFLFARSTQKPAPEIAVAKSLTIPKTADSSSLKVPKLKIERGEVLCLKKIPFFQESEKSRYEAYEKYLFHIVEISTN